jgi:hypothetical protein
LRREGRGEIMRADKVRSKEEMRRRGEGEGEGEGE